MRLLIEKHWYNTSLTFITILLLPFSYLFRLLVALRIWLYKNDFLKTYYAPVPVIVVGNITVGGTGKTPFVIWLAKFLKEKGYQPGIVSRGVGGRNKTVHLVNTNDRADKVGDEALLLLKRTACPIAIAIDRKAAVKFLLAHTTCDIIISDDGLQRYSLGRDIEIALIDGVRKFGNKQLLPAGPLRESISRLNQVNFQISSLDKRVEEKCIPGRYIIDIHYSKLVNLRDSGQSMSLSSFNRVHAVAAIGNPKRFYDILLNAGLELQTHTFIDHYLYTKSDFNFSDNLPIIMTEKDAVKCLDFSDERFWYLPIDVSMCKEFEVKLNLQLETINANKKFTKRNSIRNDAVNSLSAN